MSDLLVKFWNITFQYQSEYASLSTELQKGQADIKTQIHE